MLPAGLLPGGIGEQFLRLCTKLGSEEFDNLAGDRFTGCQQSSWKAERTELQSEAEPIPGATTRLDMGEVIVRQSVVSKQPVPIGGQ